MNAVKKKEALLEKEVRILKRDNQQLRKENKDLKDKNHWLQWLVNSYKKDLEKPKTSVNEKKPYVGKRSHCDHEFADSGRCVNCGWIP